MFDYSSISKYINRELSIERQYSSVKLIYIFKRAQKPAVKMVKIYLIAVLVAVAAVVVSAVPLPDEELHELEAFVADEYVPEQEVRADRHRRVTCDLLSFGGKVGHSACAANCLSMGKAGGRCQDGVCMCRKTTFKDLWDKRFG